MYRCLDKCCSPFGFVIEHWRGCREKWQSLLLGIRHGAFCVGCCWCLMLLMFVLGIGNVGWMLALGAVMAAEKNLPGGAPAHCTGRDRAASRSDLGRLDGAAA
jgi:predicted metal-binding membrane protein